MRICRQFAAVILGLAALNACAASPLEALFDRGKAIPFYGAETRTDPPGLIDGIKRSRLAERMASVAGGSFLLRRDLHVGFAPCGSPQAFFSRQRSAIVICYEFVELVAKIAVSDKKVMELPREQFAKIVDGALWSVYFHELGHALVAINNVPVTGRAEDVADQFSAWFALNFVPLDKVPVILPSIWLWSRMAQQRDLPSMSDDERRQFLANEHSLDEQRIYNTACLAIGARPDIGQQLIATVRMPSERAARCPAEYTQVNYAMQKAFKKFLKVRPLSGRW